MKAQKKIQTQTQESKAWPKVAIIVLNWNGWRDTIECLESLQRLTYPNYQIIVVDNGSTDDSVEKIKAWARGDIPVISKFFDYDSSIKPVQWIEYDRTIAERGGTPEEEVRIKQYPSNRRIILIKTGENSGYAGGNNVGINYALKTGSRYIFLLNNDTVVHPQVLDSTIEILENNNHIGAISPKILWHNDPTRIWYAGAKFKLWRGDIQHIGMLQPDGPKFSGVQTTEHVTGCALIARRELFEEVGLLNEDYFLIHEDCDWSLQVKKRTSFVLAVNLDARIWHKAGGISASGRIKPISAYFSNKHRLLLVFRHGSFLEKLFFSIFYVCSRPIKFTYLILKSRKDLVRAELEAVFDFLQNRYGPVDKRKIRIWKR